MKLKIFILVCLIIIATLSLVLYVKERFSLFQTSNLESRSHILDSHNSREGDMMKDSTTSASSVSRNIKIFEDNFSINYSLKESHTLSKGSSKDWWVSSGGYFYSENGVGRTIVGNLADIYPYRSIYAENNPVDTDDGYHPQNIFRLVLRSKWKNFQQTAYFKISADNLSESPNRNASNGLFLFNRYQDQFNLYYTGLRVDGTASIKKKYKGEYYEMASEVVIQGVYDRESNPNLLPKNTWIGIRSEISDLPDGKVQIKFYVDIGKTEKWTLVAEAVDNGRSYGGHSILKSGYAGIRTDFMDVAFDDYQISGK